MIKPSTPRFYREEDVPAKWTLTDLLYWVACDLLPMPFYYDEYEGRESFEALSDNFENFGVSLLPQWLEPTQTASLGLNHHPNYLLNERDEKGLEYLSSPEHHRKMANLTFTGHATEEDKLKLEITRERNRILIDVAIEHENYSKQWAEDLNEALDQYHSELILRLRRGEIVAEGINVDVASEGDFFNLAYKAFEEKNASIKHYDDAFSTIAPEVWISKFVNWEGSYVFKKTEAYLGIRLNAEDCLALYPPKSLEKVQFERGSNHLFSYDVTNNADTPKSKQGRPSKRWDAIHRKIAQIIQRENGLPAKQDAMAQEILDWYCSKFGQSIGLSTIKAKLSDYYGDPGFQKSEK